MSSAPELISPLLVSVPSSMTSTLPLHVELGSDDFGTEKYLDIRFPFKIVLKGLIIDTDRTKYLKSFTLQTAENDYLHRGVLTDIEYMTGTPIVSIALDPGSQEMHESIQSSSGVPRLRE